MKIEISANPSEAGISLLLTILAVFVCFGQREIAEMGAMELEPPHQLFCCSPETAAGKDLAIIITDENQGFYKQMDKQKNQVECILLAQVECNQLHPTSAPSFTYSHIGWGACEICDVLGDAGDDPVDDIVCAGDGGPLLHDPSDAGEGNTATNDDGVGVGVLCGSPNDTSVATSSLNNASGHSYSSSTSTGSICGKVSQEGAPSKKPVIT
jgi:hypothetical protein